MFLKVFNNTFLGVRILPYGFFQFESFVMRHLVRKAYGKTAK